MSWRGVAKTALGVGLSIALGAEAGWAAYAALRFLRYPAEPVQSAHGPSPLDEFMPEGEIDERVSVRIAASPAAVMATAWSFDIFAVPAVRGIFTGRAFLMRASLGAGLPSGPTLAKLQELGWRLLADEPGRIAIFGTVTKPWEGSVVFTSPDPDEFKAFSSPGFAKIVWSISVEPDGPQSTRLVNQTRVVTTSPEAHAKFRRYWSVFSPGILLIRYAVLRAIKAQAERGHTN